MIRKILAVAAVCGLMASAAQASEGQFIAGFRAALHYSYAEVFDRGNDGGIGFEGGLIGRYNIAPSQLGLSVGANYIWRAPVWSGSGNSELKVTEHAVSFPIILEIGPGLIPALAGDGIYEMFFLQLGLQIDRVFSYREEFGGREITEELLQWYPERADATDIGLIIGMVGYLSSNLSIDVRYTLGFNSYQDDDSRTWLGQFGLGLSVFF